MGLVVLLLGTLFNAVLIAVVVRRLLGAPVGWPRSVLIAIVVNGSASPLVMWIGDRLGLEPDGGPGDKAATFLVVAVAVACLLALQVGVLAVLEALVPTGSLPGPLTWLRQLPARWRRTRRYTSIMRIAARHGLMRYLGTRRTVNGSAPAAVTARALAAALSEGGVTFVKLGQMLATRPDLIGPEYAASLSRLHFEVSPQAWPLIHQTLEAELGQPPDEVFDHLDETPLAAASIGQVHQARLKTGECVVVKVQRSDARAQVTADLDIVLRLASWLERVAPWARNLGVRDLVSGFAGSLEEELDYRVEARNLRSIAANASTVSVPGVHASTPRMLVMDHMPGRPLSAISMEHIPPDRRQELADTLLDTILSQVLVTGTFHADLHAGNILLDPDVESGTGLSLLDFGSVGRLDKGSRTSLGTLLLAVGHQDAVAASQALTDLLGTEVRDRSLERDLGQLIMRHGAGGPADEMFRDLYALVLRHGLRIPPAMAAAFRSLAALDGTLSLLTPHRDLLTSAQERGRQMMANDLSPEGVRAALEDQLIGLLPLLHRLPQQLSSIADDVAAGAFTVTIRALQNERERRFLTGLVQQLVLAVLAATAALTGVLLVINPNGPMMTSVLPLTTFSGVVLLLFAFVLGSRVVVEAFRDSWDRRAHSGRHAPDSRRNS